MEWKFNKVKVILFETFSSINLSVSCPFTRNSRSKIILVKGKSSEVMVEISEKQIEIFECISRITTISEFMELKDDIRSVLVMKSTGVSSLPKVRVEFLELKKRLTQDQNKIDNNNSLGLKIREGNISEALNISSKLIEDHYSQNFLRVKEIDRLISFTEGELKNNYNLSNLNEIIVTDRYRRADDTLQLVIEDVNESENYGDKFNCPILMTDENDAVLLITDGNAILEKIDKDTVNELSVCPLDIFSFKNSNILDLLINRIDHSISLESYKIIYNNDKDVLSPITRRPTIGCLCLGTNEEYAKATDYVLSKIISNGKRLGNINLWFYGISFI